MDLESLKIGDPIYWKPKKKDRVGARPTRQGVYQGRIKDKIIIYWPLVVTMRGWASKGKTIEVDPEQIVEAPI